MDGTQQQGPALLQSVPLEIRRQIYSYILPYTIRKHRQNEPPVWQLGSTTILAANRQIHEEAAEVMYGGSWFHFNVEYNKINFVFRYIKRDEYLPGCRATKACEEFFEAIGPRNVSRIRQLRVYISGPMHYENGIHTVIPRLTGITTMNAVDGGEPAWYPPTREGYQATMKALVSQVSVFSKLLKPIQKIHDLCITVWFEREQHAAGFEDRLAKPLLDLNGRRMCLLSGHLVTKMEQELW